MTPEDYKKVVLRTADMSDEHRAQAVRRVAEIDPGQCVAAAYRACAAVEATKRSVIHGSGKKEPLMFAASIAIERNAAKSERLEDLHCAMGILGEAAEVVAELMANKPDADRIAKEIGDLWWYCTRALLLHGLSIVYVWCQNVEKLAKRWPDGFKEDRP